MKIAIDVSPLSSGHSVRGVGFYLKNLLNALKKYYPEHEYIEFVGKSPDNVDIVHYPYFDPFFITLPFFKHKKTVVTVHDLTPLILPTLFPVGIKGKMKWHVQRFLLHHVSRIITDSYSSKKDIEKLTGISSSRIDTVYLAAGEEFVKISNIKYQISNIKKKYNLPDKFALYVGDGTPNKNLPNLVTAALRSNIPLVMVGKVFTDLSLDLSSPWTKDVRIVRDLQKANPSRVYFLGFIPDKDLVTLYNLAYVFVMPSLYEGFGLPVLEAFASGCPVITTTRGSLHEVAGEAACFIEPENIKEIAQAIDRIVSNKNYAQKLSEQGLRQAANFSWGKTAKQTIDSYKAAFSSHT